MKIFGKIDITFDKPAASKNKLAVIMPGRLDSKDYEHLVALSNELGAIGYDTLRFNPTGTWGSSGQISDYCVSQYLKDTDSVIDWANSSNKRKYDDVVLLGHSLGGQVAMVYAATHRNISGVVAIMSPANMEGELDVSAWKSQGVKISKCDLPGNPDLFRLYKIPFSFHQDRLKYDANRDIAKFARPLLLIAGEDDKIITPEIVQATYEAANEPKMISIISGAGHDYRKYPQKIREVNQVIVDFLLEQIS